MAEQYLTLQTVSDRYQLPTAPLAAGGTNKAHVLSFAVDRDSTDQTAEGSANLQQAASESPREEIIRIKGQTLDKLVRERLQRETGEEQKTINKMNRKNLDALSKSTIGISYDQLLRDIYNEITGKSFSIESKRNIANSRGITLSNLYDLRLAVVSNKNGMTQFEQAKLYREATARNKRERESINSDQLRKE
jgi:hypothetical protein